MLTTTIVFIASDWMHSHDVDVYHIDYTEQDEDYVNEEWETFQEYVDQMVSDELDAHQQHGTYCMPLSLEAFEALKTKTLKQF